MKFVRYTLCILLLGASFSSINAVKEEAGALAGYVSGATHGALAVPSGVLTALSATTKLLNDYVNELWENQLKVVSTNPNLAAQLAYMAGIITGYTAYLSMMSKGIGSLVERGTISPGLGRVLASSAIVGGLAIQVPAVWKAGEKIDRAAR